MNSRTQQNHYEVLGVAKDATSQQVRSAFLCLSKTMHPDRNNNSPESTAAFVMLSEAYNTLYNDKKRAQYDSEQQQRQNYQQPGSRQRQQGTASQDYFYPGYTQGNEHSAYPQPGQYQGGFPEQPGYGYQRPSQTEEQQHSEPRRSGPAVPAHGRVFAAGGTKHCTCKDCMYTMEEKVLARKSQLSIILSRFQYILTNSSLVERKLPGVFAVQALWNDIKLFRQWATESLQILVGWHADNSGQFGGHHPGGFPISHQEWEKLEYNCGWVKMWLFWSGVLHGLVVKVEKRGSPSYPVEWYDGFSVALGAYRGVQVDPDRIRVRN